MSIDAHKEIRDRFIAFSFSSSDFLLEITKEGTIRFAGGTGKSLTGHDNKDLVGRDWLTLFSKKSHNDLLAILKGIQKAGRVGPLMIEVKHQMLETTKRALILGITIPDSEYIYLTINATQSFLDFLTIGDYQDHRLLDGKEFEVAAIKAFQSAKKKGKNLDVTFLDTTEIEDYKKTLSVDEANNFSDNLNAILKEQSFAGNSASQVDQDRYAIIHDEEITPEFIEEKIKELVKKTSQDAQVSIKSNTVEADMSALNEREARRALIYTIQQVEKEGIGAAQKDLGRSFDDYLNENAAKITRLKEIVGKQSFKLNFQPIVYIPSEEICHYEALIRFSGKESPYELIVFAEDIGIAPDIDMSVLRQAIGYIKKHEKKNPDIRIAVNISGQSIQSSGFFDKVLHALDENECSPKNLLFEITESTAIDDLDTVNRYIQRLRDRKFEVCLDDFGAGAASFQYLNHLDIDCVKIDGKYVKDALNSSRDEAMVRNLARMCQDLGVTTIAEMVETDAQLAYLTSIGVDKAQGWLFAKPADKAEYLKRS